jgi:hypothetical protein
METPTITPFQLSLKRTSFLMAVCFVLNLLNAGYFLWQGLNYWAAFCVFFAAWCAAAGVVFRKLA